MMTSLTECPDMPMSVSRRRTESGITLIEVLSSMVLLALGILGLAPLLTLSVSSNVFADDVTTAVVSAQEKIEEKLSQGAFAVLPLVEVDTLDNGKYTVTTHVKDDAVDPNVPPGTYEIDITLAWQDDTGQDRTLVFSTYLAKTT